MTLRRIALWFEAAVGIAFVVTVVMLFTNEPTASPAGATPAADPYGMPVAGGVDGAAIFAENCASCHGGDGSGGFGPQLSGGAGVERYPDAAGQIAVVSAGRRAMPSFADTLTDEEIAAVVDYTRTALAERLATGPR